MSPSSPVAEAHTPHPHPAAPSNIVSSFDHFQKVFASGPHFHPEKLEQPSSSNSASSPRSGSGSGLLGNVDMNGREVAEDIHLLPERFWKTPALAFSDAEMEAVMVSYGSRKGKRRREIHCADDAISTLVRIYRLEEQTKGLPITLTSHRTLSHLQCLYHRTPHRQLDRTQTRLYRSIIIPHSSHLNAGCLTKHDRAFYLVELFRSFPPS